MLITHRVIPRPRISHIFTPKVSKLIYSVSQKVSLGNKIGKLEILNICHKRAKMHMCKTNKTCNPGWHQILCTAQILELFGGGPSPWLRDACKLEVWKSAWAPDVHATFDITKSRVMSSICYLCNIACSNDAIRMKKWHFY